VVISNFRRTCARISPDVVEPFRSWLPFFARAFRQATGLTPFLNQTARLLNSREQINVAHAKPEKFIYFFSLPPRVLFTFSA
jgi:hypothetical protein